MKAFDILRNYWNSSHTPGLPHRHMILVGGLSLCLLAVLTLPSNEANSTVSAREVTVLQLAGMSEEPVAASDIAPAKLPKVETPSLKPQVSIQRDDDQSLAATTSKNVQDIENDPLNTFIPLKLDDDLVSVNVTVKKGDTLANVFQRAGATHTDMMSIVGSGEAGKQLTRIHPKQVFEFKFDKNSQLKTLTNNVSSLVTHNYDRINDRFVFNEVAKQVDTHLTSRKATISGSLFLSAKRVGMSDKVVMELANIFGYDIDFALDIREGDSFKALYEEHFVEGERVADGEILAAEFTNRGKTFHAVRYRDKSGKVAYYTPSGNSVKKEFLRTPVDFARISSHFNLKRKHPVLNKIRAHKGTDYAAATGTPIRAAGDGKVIFAGRKGGYGNTLIIKHGETYQTLYAHISKFRRGIRVGKRVNQGQVVAYVGSTGLATGPHLHYEFYVNGAVRNPVTVKLPKATSIAENDMAHFVAQTSPLLAQLTPSTPRKTTELASAKGVIESSER